MPFDLSTTISIQELVDWHLHWLIVDVEFSLLKFPDLSVADVDNKIRRVIGTRSELVNQLNIIYDHPEKLEEQLREFPKWKLLDQELETARQNAIKHNLARHRKDLERKLGTTLKDEDVK